MLLTGTLRLLCNENSLLNLINTGEKITKKNLLSDEIVDLREDYTVQTIELHLTMSAQVEVISDHVTCNQSDWFKVVM